MTTDPALMDLTYTETMKLIFAFKKHKVLWNPHVVIGYSTRKSTKDEAWKLVAAESGIPHEICHRKMRSLLSTCRKEKIRIIKSRKNSSSDKYEMPKWRYWNALKFLRGLEDDEEDPLGTAPEMDIIDPSLISKETIIRSTSSNAEQTVIKVSEVSIKFDIVNKLRKMYPNQRLHAERLIKETLDKAIKNELNKSSKVRTPGVVEGKPIRCLPSRLSDHNQPSTSKVNNTNILDLKIDYDCDEPSEVQEMCEDPLSLNNSDESSKEFKHFTLL